MNRIWRKHVRSSSAKHVEKSIDMDPDIEPPPPDWADLKKQRLREEWYTLRTSNTIRDWLTVKIAAAERFEVSVAQSRLP